MFRKLTDWEVQDILRRALTVREPLRLTPSEVRRYCQREAFRLGKDWPGMVYARQCLAIEDAARQVDTLPDRIGLDVH